MLFNGAMRVLHSTGNQGNIDFARRSILELGTQRSMGGWCQGDDHQSAGFLIKTMDDSRANAVSAFALNGEDLFSITMEQSIGKRVIPIAGGGMDDKTLRFVDHKDCIILMNDREIDRLRREPLEDRQGIFDFQLIPVLDKISFLCRFAVQPKHRAGDNRSSQLSALGSEIEIEPLLFFEV